ncbi:MAG TPA: amidohydrolase family protein [Flavitalea sp.]|nr:amidohydrolase family protein [Flavitalea sp.]
MPKYDVHIHIFTKSPYFIENSIKDNYRLLSINVDAPDTPPIQEQQDMDVFQHQKYGEEFNYATTFSVDEWNSSKWETNALSYLKSSFENGCIAVKIWKNIGMTLKDKDGKFVMVDNPRLDTVINFISKNKIPVIGHLGEPKNCWLPIDKMTVSGDKGYYKNHPQYHMYLHPEYPSYEDQINARDHMLDKHPDLIFVGAHLGSLEWDVDEIAKRLDKYPNMAVETAARVSHLQYQAITNHKKVYDFLIKYQDRILYGSDLQADDKTDSVQSFKNAHDTWLSHWKFFTSDSTLTDEAVSGSFKGLHLPKEVVDKIYFKNAQKWIPGLRAH